MTTPTRHAPAPTTSSDLEPGALLALLPAAATETIAAAIAAQVQAELGAQLAALQATMVTAQRVPGQRTLLRDLVDRVLTRSPSSSRRTRNSPLRILVSGCDALVGGEYFAGYGDRYADEITKSDLELWLKYVRACALERIGERARKREEACRQARYGDGEGAVRNAVNAARHLFTAAVDDHHLHETLNPARKLVIPKQNKLARGFLTDDRFLEVLTYAGSTGDDPDLDHTILEFLLITGARCEGVVNLVLRGLDHDDSAVLLIEKNNSQVWQPVPVGFTVALEEFARRRGACSPSDAVFRKRPRGSRIGKPITDRRMNYLFTDRIQTAFAWADKEQVTAHTIRHTALKRVERTHGKSVAQAYARHLPDKVTDIYTYASQREVATAVRELYGPDTPHPWELREPRLAR